MHGILEQIAECDQALERGAASPALSNYLAGLLLACGKIEAAAHSFHKALRLAPDNSIIHSNLLRALLLNPDISIQVLADAHASFGRSFDQPITGFGNNRSLRRPLNIGYVSDGLRAHAVPFFFEQILRNHDRKRFIIHCFSNSSANDQVSRRLRRLSDSWVDISSMADDEAAALIRRHQLDILVEIGGHTGDNRLKLMAHRAAPVQISTWDYPFTVGSRNIDYHLTDANLCPPFADRFFIEKLIRLPVVAMCYQPPRPSPPVSPLPALRNGFLTFAAFHSMSKLTPASIQMWAGVMKALPRSRLILHHLFEGHRRVSKAFRFDVERTFHELGISSKRLRFVGALPHVDTLRLYREADLTLDSFPFSGCTTTAESLWMGVPVITWAGDRPSSRHSVTMLRAINLSQFIGSSPEDCTRIALDCAADLKGLALMRRSLRGRIQHSPLTDGSAHTKRIETVYRQVWTHWVRAHS